jgi:flavin reductase (DIM6/NTAB) family NADH-FMN oxidoreductase RutF
MATASLSPDLYRRIMGNFATGVTVVTAEREPGKVHGMTANSFTSVSLDPLLILVCVDQNAQLLSFLKTQRRFGVNMLRSDQQSLSEHFAKPHPPPEEERQLNVQFEWTDTGIPLLRGVLGRLACNVAAQYMAGDHTIFIGEVESIHEGEWEPLLYHRRHYCQLQSHHHDLLSS